MMVDVTSQNYKHFNKILSNYKELYVFKFLIKILVPIYIGIILGKNTGGNITWLLTEIKGRFWFLFIF